jgi:ubiquitin carboxyl-terminal hydrolase 47
VESVGKKVDAIKGLKFGKLPQIISCNLKRFVFDFSGDNITQKKLNDIVRFPMILDMNRYVSKNRPRSASLSLNPTENVADCGQDDDFEVFLREQINLLRNKARAGNDGTSPATDTEDDDPTLPDLVDVNGNKCPEQVADEEKKNAILRAEERVWKREEVDKLISERGEWVYELFAVLIHSGAIHGGHYYAYIKNLDSEYPSEWWNFNDSSVTRIDESKVREAWGGMNTYGRVSTQSCANAYMLMYRKVVPSWKVEANTAQSGFTTSEGVVASTSRLSQKSESRLARYQVPDYIRDEIIKLEDEAIQKAKAIDEAKNKISVKVRCCEKNRLYLITPLVHRSRGMTWIMSLLRTKECYSRTL